jgi:hypothetical protein
MEVPPGLLGPATEARLRQALAGTDVALRLHLGALQAGATGVVEAAVRQVHPVRPYVRKNGGNGLIGKVTLADATGEAVLVLWDDETRLLQDGPFQPGAFLRLQGASVRAGRRGEAELALGAAIVTPLEAAASPLSRLEGTFLGVGPTRVTGAPPAVRFQADAQVQAPGGVAHIALEGEPLRDLRSILPGATVALDGVTAHPVLEGWWIAGPATTVRRL